MSFMMVDYKKSYGRLSPVLQRSLLEEYQTRSGSKIDKKEDEAMGVSRGDAFNISFRPHRVDRASLYLDDLTTLPPSLASFAMLSCHGSFCRVIVATQLRLPKQRARLSESIMIPSRNTRHES